MILAFIRVGPSSSLFSCLACDRMIVSRSIICAIRRLMRTEKESNPWSLDRICFATLNSNLVTQGQGFLVGINVHEHRFVKLLNTYPYIAKCIKRFICFLACVIQIILITSLTVSSWYTGSTACLLTQT